MPPEGFQTYKSTGNNSYLQSCVEACFGELRPKPETSDCDDNKIKGMCMVTCLLYRISQDDIYDHLRHSCGDLSQTPAVRYARTVPSPVAPPSDSERISLDKDAMVHYCMDNLGLCITAGGLTALGLLKAIGNTLGNRAGGLILVPTSAFLPESQPYGEFR